MTVKPSSYRAGSPIASPSFCPGLSMADELNKPCLCVSLRRGRPKDNRTGASKVIGWGNESGGGMCHVTQSLSDWGMTLVDAAREHTYGRNDHRAFGMHRAGSTPAHSHLKDQKYKPHKGEIYATI